MFRNYLTVALRNLTRHKLFATINVLGLGLGMACCLLILLFIRHELRYDRHVPDADHIYQIRYHTTTGNDLAAVPPPMAPRLTEFFSEIEVAARAFSGSVSVRVPEQTPGEGNRTFEEDQTFFVDSTFTRIFPLEIVAGDPAQDLRQPSTVVLSEETAERFFGNRNPIGQTITIEGDYTFTVTGVAKDFPTASHLHFNLLLPYDDMFRIQGPQAEAVMRQNLGMNWVISHSITYVKLKPGASPENVNSRFEAMVTEYAPPQLQVGQRFSLTPLLDIHLRTPDVFLQPEPPGDMQYVLIFAGIAFLTLLLPCFNFVNLATAQSIGRTQEIGVRQALGAHRKQLFAQFLGESLVICMLAFVLALGLTLLGLPLLSDLVQRELSAEMLLDPLVIGGFVAVLLLTGLLGGSYPAFLISRTNIVTALRKSKGGVPVRGLSLRKVLVAVQFAISISLIAGAFLIYQQLNYLLNRPLGFATEHTITVPLYSQNLNTIFAGVNANMRSRLDAFEATIAQHPRIHASTLSRNAPGLGSIYRGTVPEGHASDTPLFVPAMAVDYDFMDFYGMEIVAGRGFEQERGTDHTNAFVVNETAVRDFGWGTPSDALGKTINLEGKEGQVVGVVKDYNFQSLQNAIGPMLMEINVPAFQTLSVRMDTADREATLAYLEQQWAEFFPEQAFSFTFLDEQIQQQYDTQQRLGGLIQGFALLGIVVSCLGAYGLVMFSTRQRLREIGVRKVLGASLVHILALLYRELTLLFVAGLVLAAPVVYLAGKWWLEDFTYRITLGPGVLLLSGGVMLLLAWLTISYQSLKAARVNPVACLRTE